MSKSLDAARMPSLKDKIREGAEESVAKKVVDSVKKAVKKKK